MRRRVLVAIGFVLLAGVTAVLWLQRGRADGTTDSNGLEIIRVAHWQIESGTQRALGTLIADYEALHPGVRVEQLAIPPRGYPAWLRTQLVGGTAPDLVQVGHNVPGLYELLARYFTPISDWVVEPNPYNEGTTLAGVPLRDTVVDGMGATMVFVQSLQEYYAVPLSIFTVRVFYNRDRWRDIFGDRAPPSTYSGFIDLCTEVAGHRSPGGRPWQPVAGSRTTGWLLLNRLFLSQTQQLDRHLAGGSDFGLPSFDLGLAYLRGEWRFASDGPSHGLALMQDVGKHLQPGFTQMEAGDELFQFLQERAFMMLTSSAYLTAIRENAGFEVGFFELPVPEASHPRFGAGVVGPRSEASIGAEFPLALTLHSPNPSRAKDFLQYLASQKANARFAAESGWIPSIVGIDVAPAVQALQPRIDGVALGFDTRLRSIGPEVVREMQQTVHQLFGPAGDAGQLAAALDRVMPRAIRSDLQRQRAQRMQALAQQDPAIAAQWALSGFGAVPTSKLERMLESQLDLEATNWWIERGLRDTQSR